MQRLIHAVRLLKAATRKIGEKRSSLWPTVEKHFLTANPTCAACGSSKRLNVHHKRPFHLDPALELDTANLITLCMDKDCHLLIGHGDNFKAYNPNVEQDALAAKNGEDLSKVAERAKQNRLFE